MKMPARSIATLVALFSSWLAAGIAEAAVVGYAESEGGRIDLHDERGQCAGQALQAEFVGPTGERVAGCWIARSGQVLVVFMDTDVARIPVRAVLPAKVI